MAVLVIPVSRVLASLSDTCYILDLSTYPCVYFLCWPFFYSARDANVVEELKVRCLLIAALGII